jgi:signal transduction histidine kinase
VFNLVITTINMVLLTNSTLREIFLDQGIEISKNLARNSSLAILYSSKENASPAITATLSFPAVESASILTDNLDVLIRSGNADTIAFYDLISSADSSSAKMIFEDENYWHFSAPIHADTDDFNVQLYNTQLNHVIVGYVYVIINKAVLSGIQTDLYTNNLAVSLFMTPLIILVLLWIINHITKPLLTISGVMKRKKEYRGSSLFSPPEIRDIEDAYNTMIKEIHEKDAILTRHNVQLEHEVSIRTQELRLARDRAISANIHKSEFLANTTHELRTPLQSIIGYCDLTIDALEEQGVHDMVNDQKRILSNAQNLLSLINSLLDLSRLEAGKMELKPVTFSIGNTIHRLTETMRPLLRKNNNTLTVAENYLATDIYADEDKIYQILLNLLRNADKFTHEGEITMKVTSSAQQLTVSVQDTGIGIAEESLERIFEPFTQADGSLTRNYSGTGLGLTISRQLCSLMDGNITVTSEVGRGSCFNLQIPLNQN